MADQGRSEPSRTAPIRRFERSSRSRLVRRKGRRNASARHPRPFTPPDVPVDMEPRAAVASAASEPPTIVAVTAPDRQRTQPYSRYRQKITTGLLLQKKKQYNAT